jgi:hypothetical protein
VVCNEMLTNFRTACALLDALQQRLRLAACRLSSDVLGWEIAREGANAPSRARERNTSIYERQIRLMTNSHKSQSEKLATGGGRETTAEKPYNNEVPGPHH